MIARVPVEKIAKTPHEGVLVKTTAESKLPFTLNKPGSLGAFLHMSSHICTPS